MSAGLADDPLLDDVALRSALGDRIVLVHGGGPQIDAALASAGIVTERIEGLRVTDEPTLVITESVLCGAVNKALVRALLRRGVRAVGISGEDDGLITARPVAPVGGRSLGFVGEVASVQSGALRALLDAGFLPVVAPLGLASDASSVFNVNADTVAGAIAGSLCADAYVVVTNVERVLFRVDDPNSGIARLTAAKAREYLDDGTFGGGMKPKIESALDALARGAKSAIVCGSGRGVLGRALSGESGTLIVGNE